MTIRRKRRQRGKRKELRREALKTWERLAQPALEPRKYEPLPSMAGILLPTIRKIMPTMIANDLVGVQPLAMPTGMIGDSAPGIEPTFKWGYSYGNRTKKEISEQRKKERKDKKYAKGVIKRASRGLDKIEWGDLTTRAGLDRQGN